MPQTEEEEEGARGGIAVNRIMVKTTLLSERGNQEARSQSALNPLLVLFVSIAKFYNLPRIAISVGESFRRNLKSVHGKKQLQVSCNIFLSQNLSGWRSILYINGSD